MAKGQLRYDPAAVTTATTTAPITTFVTVPGGSSFTTPPGPFNYSPWYSETGTLTFSDLAGYHFDVLPLDTGSVTFTGDNPPAMWHIGPPATTTAVAAATLQWSVVAAPAVHQPPWRSSVNTMTFSDVDLSDNELPVAVLLQDEMAVTCQPQMPLEPMDITITADDQVCAILADLFGCPSDNSSGAGAAVPAATAVPDCAVLFEEVLICSNVTGNNAENGGSGGDGCATASSFMPWDALPN